MTNDPCRAELLYCSFCGKCQTEVNVLCAGGLHNICSECVDLCNHMIADFRAKPATEHNPAAEVLLPDASDNSQNVEYK